MSRSDPRPRKELPAGAGQHATAGPYSPVLVIHTDRLVVISGQAAIAPDGSVTGRDIEEQTHATLENCRRQLATAGCTFADVVKVTGYLTDLSQWQRFNAVYETYLPEPRPVRTVVGAALLDGLLVEVEMWAVAP
ncbi:RidA family protein [Jiangella gansuensis]|uniref:RidA family protein n=1 Tax=Jiangella gansuensis TaxID=281473 RepID=UPI00047B5C13|nr:RidA family protein [Jiangella gansuensis]